mmetsp:Transcript_14000/g.33608  ORF Transcript_14000/g.33608 Transcript_14000/m.33608 type:complete len:752 (-) Transcript_14000:84-2339(-)
MPTEVGISLALRRHNSLIRSHQDSGRRISSKQKSGNSDDNGDNGSGSSSVGGDGDGDGDYDNSLEYRRLKQQDNYQPQREQVSQSEGTHTFRYKNGNNGHKRRPRRNSRTTSNTRDRKKNGSSSTSIAQSIKKKRPLSSTATSSTVAAAAAEPPENSWHVLRDGMLIYISCMVLPTVVRWCLVVVVRNNRLSQSVVRKLCGASSPQSSSSSTTLVGWFSSILPSCQNSLLWEQMAVSMEDDISTTGIDKTETSSTSVLAPDAGLSDFAIVGFLALFFASLRIILMYLLVPKLSEPKRMAALVRCKSIHLLSGSYQGSMTPVRPNPRLLLSDLHKLPDLPNLYGAEEETDSVEPKPPLMPDLDRYTTGADQTKIINHNESLQRQIEDQEEDEDEWFSGDAAEEESDENEEDGEMVDDEGEENQLEAPIVQSGLLSKSSALSLTQLLEQASGHQPPVPSVNGRMSRRNSASSRLHEETDDIAGGGRVYAAPKFATAIFRLLFCLMSSLTAYVSFVKAEWWPPILLGHGSTLNCWSLSSVGLAMDADFDLYNTALRRYYLIQASYHVHSAAFHIFTSMLLWFVSKSSRRSSQYGKGEGSVFRFYNIHTFFRHCFSIGLILVTYLFSSTRRLGAIAMFALDLSNIPLHVLQIRINAPTQSRIPIRFLHALVLLSFCFLRIYVCIFVIAFSALEESQSSGWLEQLSSMQSGVANAMKGVFVIGFIFYLVLTAVYFIRLVTHSHVQEKVLAQDRTSN